MFGEKLHELVAIHLAELADGGQHAELGQPFAQLGAPLIDIRIGDGFICHGHYLVVHSSGAEGACQAKWRRRIWKAGLRPIQCERPCSGVEDHVGTRPES